jgi:hypothetical protein
MFKFLFRLIWWLVKWLGPGVAAYALWLRPKHVRWGARDEEVIREMPGDDLIVEPKGTTTRAITIEAPPEKVWPWLVQIGQGRGGFYTYDWLQQLGGIEIDNVSEIIEEYQDLKVGDIIRLAPESEEPDLYMEVHAIEGPKTLVLRTPSERVNATPDFYFESTWAFQLEPVGEHATRLLSRTRTVYEAKAGKTTFHRALLEPGQFIMERKMLLGIKERVESVPPVPDSVVEE